jgi:hypothetical protein
MEEDVGIGRPSFQGVEAGAALAELKPKRIRSVAWFMVEVRPFLPGRLQ